MNSLDGKEPQEKIGEEPSSEPTGKENPIPPAPINWKKDLTEALVSKKGLYVFLLVLGLVCGRLGLNYFMRGGAHIALPVVKVLTPQVRAMDSSMTLPGNMEAIEQASLYAHVSGYLKKIFVDEGDQVKKDQLLAQIDAPDVVDEYNRLKAELNLKKVTKDRYEALLNEKVISQQEFDTIAAAYDEAKAKYDAAAANMEFTQIRAPFDGSIARRYKYPGDLISLANKGDVQPIFLIVNESTLRVVLNIPQVEMGHIKEGSSVDIKVDSFPDQVFQGQVTRLDALLDEATKTQRVLVDIKNADGRLHAGMFASVVVHFDHKNDALTVPVDAIEKQGDENFIYVFRDGEAKKVPVKLGLKDDKGVEVVDGIAAGDKIIAKGSLTLKDGMKVQAIETPSSGPAVKPATVPVESAPASGAMETAAKTERK